MISRMHIHALALMWRWGVFYDATEFSGTIKFPSQENLCCLPSWEVYWSHYGAHWQKWAYNDYVVDEYLQTGLFFTERVVIHWKCLPRGVIDVLSFSGLERHLDNALDLLQFLLIPKVPKQLDYMVILCPFQLEYCVLIMKACSMEIQQEFLYFKIITISKDGNFLWSFTVLGAEPNTQDWN